MNLRADEVQYGARTPQQRILQTTHSSGRKLLSIEDYHSEKILMFSPFFVHLFDMNAVGPNIHYHINTGVVKKNATENPNIGGPAPTVQYTTCKIVILLAIERYEF